jgi:hypothetical protein
MGDNNELIDNLSFIKDYIPTKFQYLFNYLYEENFQSNDEVLHFTSMIKNCLTQQTPSTYYFAGTVEQSLDPVYYDSEYETTGEESAEYMQYNARSLNNNHYIDRLMTTLFHLVQKFDMRNIINTKKETFTSIDIFTNVTPYEEIISMHVEFIKQTKETDIDSVSHIFHNFYKLIYHILNYQILNTISLLPTNIESEPILSKALTTLTNSLTILKTRFGMNQSNLNLEVQNSTTNSRYLKVTVTNFPALRIYKKIKSSKFVLLKSENGVIIEEYIITNNLTINGEEPNKIYELELNKSATFEQEDELEIRFISPRHLKLSYNTIKNDINALRRDVQSSKDEYQNNVNLQTYIETIYKGLDYSTILFYAMFVIVCAVLIVGGESKSMKVFISLISIGVVSFLYVGYLGLYTLQEDFNAEGQAQYETRTENILENAQKFIENIQMTLNIVEMKNVHNDVNKQMNKDRQKLAMENKAYDSKVSQSEVKINDKRLSIFISTLRITVISYLCIVLLAYNILTSVYPEKRLMFIFIISLLLIYIIYYYIYSLHRVVRTNYQTMYFPKGV